MKSEKRTVVDITNDMHTELSLLTKVAGTKIRDEVQAAIAAHLEKRWADPGTLDGLNRIQEKIQGKVSG